MNPSSRPQISSSRDMARALTVVKVQGSVSAQQVRDQIVGFLTGEPTRYVIWDVRDGSLSQLSAEDMRMLVTAGAPHAHRRTGGRTAIICATDVDFGMGRMFQTIASLQHVPFEIRVFRDTDEAMSWLDLPCA